MASDALTTSRRSMLGILAAAPLAAAVPALAAAQPAWSVYHWVDRWWAEGCGLSVRANSLDLRVRLNGDLDAIGKLLAEITSAERQADVIAVQTAVQSFSGRSAR